MRTLTGILGFALILAAFGCGASPSRTAAPTTASPPATTTPAQVSYPGSIYDPADQSFLEHVRDTAGDAFPPGWLAANSSKLPDYGRGICADLGRGVSVDDELAYLPEHSGLPGPDVAARARQATVVLTAALVSYCPQLGGS